MGFFQGSQEQFRNSRGNEPSVFEPLKFYCIYDIHAREARPIALTSQTFRKEFEVEYFPFKPSTVCDAAKSFVTDGPLLRIKSNKKCYEYMSGESN